MASVADQLPDQDDLRSSQLPGPPPAEEGSQRAVVWDGEQLTLDEACDRSFETQQEKRETARKRRPLGRLNPVSGQIVRTPSTSEGLGMDLEMEMETQNGTETERSIPARTHSMVDAEKLELARVSSGSHHGTAEGELILSLLAGGGKHAARRESAHRLARDISVAQES